MKHQAQGPCSLQPAAPPPPQRTAPPASKTRTRHVSPRTANLIEADGGESLPDQSETGRRQQQSAALNIPTAPRRSGHGPRAARRARRAYSSLKPLVNPLGGALSFSWMRISGVHSFMSLLARNFSAKLRGRRGGRAAEAEPRRLCRAASSAAAGMGGGGVLAHERDARQGVLCRPGLRPRC